MNPKRVFISYSHDSVDHKVWVRQLAEYFRENGVDAWLDQWDLEFGDDLAAFMESGIAESDRVIIICTDIYNEKANSGSGGVGYEKTIVTAEMLSGPENRRKFIPIVRNVTSKIKLPSFLGAKYYANMSDAADLTEERRRLLDTVFAVPPRKPPLGVAPFIPENAPPGEEIAKGAMRGDSKIGSGDPCIVFGERFAQAFPGVRGVKWFDDAEVIRERLGILLAPPLHFSSQIQDGYSTLAWWWRGMTNMHIDRFTHVEGRHFLLDHDELNIARIAAVNFDIYYRCFVYLEANADEKTGLYEWSQDRLDRSLKLKGFADEEYGLVDGTLPISRDEFDDGAAIVDGRPVDVRGRVELRSRHITPYNFIIAPNCSPINVPSFDQFLENFLNSMLKGEAVLDDLVARVRRLPRRH